MSNLLSGAKILLNCLARENVECIFGYPGGVTLPLYDALYDFRIRHVLVRHEQNAAFAAQGYARTTGKVGVCCATSGPGATNLVTGLVDAMMDSIPIVALTGQVSAKLMGTRRLSRSGHVRHHQVRDQAQFPCEEHQRPAASHSRGLLHRRIRPSRARACRRHERRVSSAGALRARDRNSSARLSRVQRRPQRADSPRRADDVGSGAAVRIRGRRHHRGECQPGIARIRRASGCSHRVHVDGPGRAAERASQFHQHARHARQLCRQHGHVEYRPDHRARRSFRRSRDGPSSRLRAAREDHPRRCRSRGNRQEPPCRSAHRGRCEKCSSES